MNDTAPIVLNVVLLALLAAFAVVGILWWRNRSKPWPSVRTPLERAREAAEQLSPGDRERFRRWFEGRWPASHSEGITP
jgi:uncharacterized membrane protein